MIECSRLNRCHKCSCVAKPTVNTSSTRMLPSTHDMNVNVAPSTSTNGLLSRLLNKFQLGVTNLELCGLGCDLCIMHTPACSWV